MCNALLGDGDTPLVYHGRTYHQLVPSTDLGVSPVADETIDSLLYDYPLPRRFARVHPPELTSPNPEMTHGYDRTEAGRTPRSIS